MNDKDFIVNDTDDFMSKVTSRLNGDGYNGIDINQIKFVKHCTFVTSKRAELYNSIEDMYDNTVDDDRDNIYVEYLLPNGYIWTLCVFNPDGGTFYSFTYMFKLYNKLDAGQCIGTLSVENYNKIMNLDKLIDKL